MGRSREGVGKAVKKRWEGCEQIIERLWKNGGNVVESVWKRSWGFVELSWKKLRECGGRAVGFLGKYCGNVLGKLWECSGLFSEHVFGKLNFLGRSCGNVVESFRNK